MTRDGKKEVYLAGSITGLTFEEATGWRNAATERLEAAGYAVLDPMHGKTGLKGETVLIKWPPTHKMGPDINSHDDMANRDYDYVAQGDVLLANLVDGPSEVSVGTLQEIGYAKGMRKRVILILKKGEDNPYDHPLTYSPQAEVVETLEEALQLLEASATPIRTLHSSEYSFLETEPVVVVYGPAVVPDQQIRVHTKEGEERIIRITSARMIDDEVWECGFEMVSVEIANVDPPVFSEPATFEQAVHRHLSAFETLFIGKHQDYGPGNILINPGIEVLLRAIDPEWKLRTDLSRQHPKVTIAAQGAVLTRVGDKVARLTNLLSKALTGDDDSPRHESIEDTWRDLIGYSLVCIMVLNNEFLLPLEEDTC